MVFRRKLTLPALAVMSVITIYEVLGHFVAFATGLCLTGCLFWFVKGKGNGGHGQNIRQGPCGWIIYVSLGLIWLSLVHLYCIDSADRMLPEMAEKRVEISGTVLDIGIKKNEDGDRMSLEVRADRVDDLDLARPDGVDDLALALADRVDDLALARPEKVLIDGPYDKSIAIGDRISGEGKIRIPEPKRNPNTFDYRNYLRTKGIYTTMYSEEDITVIVSSDSISSRLYRMKESYLEDLRSRAGEGTADMMRAILFGDKGRIDEDIEETFRMNGTAHVLAVSGLHVGMVYGLLLFLWNRLGSLLPGPGGGRRGWIFLVCVGTMLVSYAFLAGFAPSVVRAVIMILLHIFASMTGRYYDLKSATLAVFIVSLVVDPLILFQSGFQMSFLAILSLSIVIPYLRRFLSGAILAGACIQVGLMPYMIYQFNWLSLPAVLINVPVIFLAGLIVPLGLIAFIVSAVLGAFAGASGSMGWEHGFASDLVSRSGPITIMMDRSIAFLCDLMIRLNDICCIEGVTAIRVCSPPVWMVLLFYMSLVAFASESGRLRIKRLGKKAVRLQIAVILVISIGLSAAIDDGFKRMDMVFVDVGQGDCMHLRVKDGPGLFGEVLLPFKTKNYLIDGGGDDDYEVGRKILRPYLLKNGVRTIDGAFVTHLHTDHYRGICELAREGMVRHIYLYEANRLKSDEICRDTGLDRDRIHFLAKGDRVFLSGHTDHIDVIWPERKSDREYERMLADEEDENASSLIMRLILEDVSMLATGDLGEEGEREIIGAYAQPSSATGGPTENQPVGRSSMGLESDILKVGHHGSKYSSCDEFLDAVSPRVAVIQVSKGNTYGHPTPEVLKRLADRGIPTYRNDLQGAIGFSLSSVNLRSKFWDQVVYPKTCLVPINEYQPYLSEFFGPNMGYRPGFSPK